VDGREALPNLTPDGPGELFRAESRQPETSSRLTFTQNHRRYMERSSS
jgi:hypothetical protein